MKVRGKTTQNISIPRILGDVEITAHTTEVVSIENAVSKVAIAETYGNQYVKGETTQHEFNMVNDNINLSAMTLTASEANNILHSLRTVSAKTITFTSATYDALTSDQKAVATNKGWTVASA